MVSDGSVLDVDGSGLRISVFGLGYVGTVTAGCLAAQGHQVVGVELNPEKLRFIGKGRAPVFEPGADDLIQSALVKGLLSIETDSRTSVHATDISFVCVGTPTNRTGRPDYGQIERVCREIGAALAEIDHYHVVNIRSTVLPGTIAGIVRPLLEQCSGKRADRDFG